MKRIKILLYLCLLILMGCLNDNADVRIRKYFGFSNSVTLTVENVRLQLLLKIPAGSSEKQVYAFLEQSGIGKDNLSSYYPLNKNKEIVCRIEYNPKTLPLVKKSYGIFFIMDDLGYLKDIYISEWKTGL